MPSSTSSSDPTVPRGRGLAVPASSAELPTADAVQRDVPPWPRWVLPVFAVLLTLAVAAWELAMRAVGLRAGDLGDAPAHWAQERRAIDRRDVEVALLGDSRLLFATDLALFEQLTGARTVQLSVRGTNALFLLEDLADDADFTGLVVLGLTETSYFRPRFGIGERGLNHYRGETPAQWFGHQIDLLLSRHLAFLDEGHRLSKLAVMAPWVRDGVRGPYDSPWKVSESRDRRMTSMWPTVYENPWRLAQARRAWNDFRGPPIDDAILASTLERSAKAVAKIRARGGDVVFLRPPSSGPVLVNERVRAPRDRVWEALLRATASRGLHFEDDPALTAMDVPEYSHLTADCASHYTHAYAQWVVAQAPRLVRGAHRNPDALKPTSSCAPVERAVAEAPPQPAMPPPPPAGVHAR